MTADVDTIKMVTREQANLFNNAIRNSSLIYDDLLNGNGTNSVKKNVEGLGILFFE
jgi:hypothetical protein